MKTDTLHLLGTAPLTTKPGQPLRVAVYARVAETIVSGKALPGTMLPTEAEVGETLGVSRTVVREALMLLEEDQLITTRRGIGRFVALEPAKFGLERIAPFDELLRSAEPGRVFELSSFEAYVQGGTEFTARGLDVDDHTGTWFWEYLVTWEGRPVAMLQGARRCDGGAGGRGVAATAPCVRARPRDGGAFRDAAVAHPNRTGPGDGAGGGRDFDERAREHARSSLACLCVATRARAHAEDLPSG